MCVFDKDKIIDLENQLKNSRIERNLLQRKLQLALDKLREIEEHEHCISGCRSTGINGCLELDEQTNVGTAKGHRCCAEIARETREKAGKV